MSDSMSFYRNFVSQINQTINDLQALNTMQDRMAADPGLAAASADSAAKSGRPELATQDFVNAAAAINQLLFTLSSGNPTQKSYLYKML